MSGAAISEAQVDFALKLMRQLSANNGGASTPEPMPRNVGNEGTMELQLLGMPYVGNEMLMYIVLPKNKFGLAEVLAELTGAALLGLLQKRDGKREVEISLPKFKLESTHDLKEPLIELGIPNAFSGANFGGIAKGQLMIDRVVQKAFIELESTHDAGADAEDRGRCRQVLVNAIYFKGMWAAQFDVHRTNKGPFHVAEGVQKELDMMHNKKRFIYSENEKALG